MLVLACGTLTVQPAWQEAHAAGPDASWTRSWGTALATAAGSDASGVSGQQTLRMVVHTSIGGSTARIQLSNTFSKSPVTIGHATLAHRAGGAAAVGRPATLTFGGGRQVVLGPGESRYSDPVAFPVKADEDLLVSLFLPNPVQTAPYHPDAWTTTYLSGPADRTDDPGGSGYSTRDEGHWAFLSGLDVTADGNPGTVVAIGDSQTDVGATTKDANRRWTDDYARSLRAQGRPMGVSNAGLSANRLLTRGERAAYGESTLERFDRDVLAQPNVKSVILYEGINDIVNDAKADDLVAGIRRLAQRSRAAGVPMTVATIPPFKGFWRYTPEREAVRRQVNAYIRTTSDIDARVDFDQATRDPLDTERVFTAYRTDADKLHFTDNGSQALADALAGPVPPSPFTPNFTQTTAADFTGDGIADIVARTTDGEAKLYLWKGLGDGTFSRPDRDHPLTTGWNITETKAGDVTGDGKADLIGKAADGDLYMWAGHGDGTFDARRKLYDDWHYTQTTAADLDGDGVADLLARDAGGTLHRWYGRRGGTLGDPTTMTDGWNYTQTTAGDFTGDGRPDLVARGANGDLFLWKGDGDGTFDRADLGKPVVRDWHYSETTAGTFYGGGTAHLLARDDESGVLRQWVNRGGADFSAPLRMTDGW
ncbi:hypothetical protein GCM10010218_40390 [Streptomyces mashuensis]|uniref:SGNH hydrolase-type esterase domain-containing protein n=1 Tax=Streptomyces mashuensis TaxID=33904 RepID=A0A919ED57_9ACTN|nr:hypothetical protein GCM10010218_40390 [Streptomyces mashuensis]